jgi:cell division protein FtsI (penicillin-binding protein 3)
MAFVVFIAVIFAARLVQFQIVQAPQINAESFQRRSITTVIPAMRGDIVDANGKILATTVMSYDINVDPTMVAPYSTKINNVDTTVSVFTAAKEMAAILGMQPADVVAKLKGTSHYSQVAKQVDGATYLKIKRLDIPWVFPAAVPHRIYPNGALAGNILGFVNAEGTPLEGLEYSQNKCLAGVDGKETYQRGVDGIKIPGSADITVAPKDGGTLKLTIDSDLQYYAQQVMAKYVRNERADWGSAIVVEVKTGKILAAAEAPSVDPNNYTAVDAANRSSRIFRATFEPGSTVKMVTAATAVDQGVATPLTQVKAPQSIYVANGFRISDSHVHPTERLTLQGVLIESSNTGIVQIGQKVPYSTRYNYWTKFGLGSRTAVDFPGEASGIVHATAPDDASVFTSMFGQAMTVTPMQSAFVYQTFANLGVRLTPQLMETCTAADGTVTPGQAPQKAIRVLKTSTARQVISMLENDVAQTGGVGSTAAIPGYRIGGKSGTAQIANDNGIGYGLLHAISFIGMAPAEDPQYVLAVTIYKPRTVSNSIGATPPFKQILEQVLRTYRVPPSTTKLTQIAAHW